MTLFSQFNVNTRHRLLPLSCECVRSGEVSQKGNRNLTKSGQTLIWNCFPYFCNGNNSEPNGWAGVAMDGRATAMFMMTMLLLTPASVKFVESGFLKV